MRRLGAVAVILLAIGLAGWFARDDLLRETAALWIRSDPLGPADVVVVLGGGIDDRPLAAADYYNQGLVKKILVSDPQESEVEKLSGMPSQAAATQAFLLKRGVPLSAIEIFGDDVGNTYDEAVAARGWAESQGVRSLIVPTEIFSARRVAWIFQHVFGPGFVIRVTALNPTRYSAKNWWQNERGVIDFQNEILKYVYYRFKY